MSAQFGRRAAPDATFQRAYLAAVSAVGEGAWSRLPINEQSCLIYDEMRRIDAEDITKANLARAAESKSEPR